MCVCTHTHAYEYVQDGLRTYIHTCTDYSECKTSFQPMTGPHVLTDLTAGSGCNLTAKPIH